MSDVIARNRTSMLYVWRGSSSLVVDNDGITGALPIGGSGGAPSRYGILTRSLDLRLSYRLHHGSCDIDLAITNRWNERAELDLEWLFDADYAGVPEVLGKRMQEATVAQTSDRDRLVFRYEHEKLPYRTSIEPYDGIDWTIDDRRLRAHISAPRHETVVARLYVTAEDFEDPISDDDRITREARVHSWLDSVATLHADAESPIVEITNRALRDLGSLALLEGNEDEWLYPGAGVPLYLNFWGRDGLTTGWQAGALDGCGILRSVLARLGSRQGTRVDHETEEEPGRILNREEPTPSSRLGIQPFRRFYADFASPFMFIISLGQFFAWTADKETVRSHWDTACRILEWARTYADPDGDGYLEYVKHSSKGPKHQGWKDSENAVAGERGEQIGPPIAAAEVQAYYYASLQFMAVLGLFLGERKRPRKWWREAVELKRRFNRDFWMEDEGIVAFGLDAEKRQIRTVASNAGHCLAAGIIRDDRIPRVVDRLFASDMFSGWGIRTMTSRNPAYNPLDYHLGSIWTVENGTILFGLRRYGFDARVLQLARALVDLAMIWPGGRIPECVGGYGRDEYAHPGAYPQANAPQAWNQSVWPIMIQSILGLQPAASFHLLGVDPILPEWLPEVTLRGLRVGEGTVSIHFWRDRKGHSHFEVVEKRGTLHVLRQPPINAINVHWWSRLRAAAMGSGL